MAVDGNASDTSSEGSRVRAYRGGVKQVGMADGGPQHRESTSPASSSVMSITGTSPSMTMDESIVFEEMLGTRASMKRMSVTSTRTPRTGYRGALSGSPRPKISQYRSSPTFAESLVFEEVVSDASPLAAPPTRHDFTLSCESLVFEEVGCVSSASIRGRPPAPDLHESLLFTEVRADVPTDLLDAPREDGTSPPADASPLPRESHRARTPPARQSSGGFPVPRESYGQRSSVHPRPSAGDSDGGWQTQLRGDAYKEIRRHGHAFLYKNATSGDTLRLQNGYHKCAFGAPPDAPLTQERLDRFEALDRCRDRKSFRKLRVVDHARRDGDACPKCGDTRHILRNCPQAAREAGFSSAAGAKQNVVGTFPSLPPVPNTRARASRVTPDLSGVRSRFREWEAHPQGERHRQAASSAEPVRRNSRAATPPSRPTALPSPRNRTPQPQSARAPRPKANSEKRGAKAQSQSQPPPERRDGCAERRAGSSSKARSGSSSANRSRSVSPRVRARCEEPKAWVLRLSRPNVPPQAPPEPAPAPAAPSSAREVKKAPAKEGERPQSTVIKRLQTENKKLQEAIEQMRAKMKNLENIGKQPLTAGRKPTRAAGPALARSASSPQLGVASSAVPRRGREGRSARRNSSAVPLCRTFTSPAAVDVCAPVATPDSPKLFPDHHITPPASLHYTSSAPAQRSVSGSKRQGSGCHARPRMSAPSYEDWQMLKRHATPPRDDETSEVSPQDPVCAWGGERGRRGTRRAVHDAPRRGSSAATSGECERVVSQSTTSLVEGRISGGSSGGLTDPEPAEGGCGTSLEARIETLELLQHDVRAALQHSAIQEPRVGLSCFGRIGAGCPGIPLNVQQLHAQRAGDARVMCVDDGGAGLRRCASYTTERTASRTRESRAMMNVVKRRWQP